MESFISVWHWRTHLLATFSLEHYRFYLLSPMPWCRNDTMCFSMRLPSKVSHPFPQQSDFTFHLPESIVSRSAFLSRSLWPSCGMGKALLFGCPSRVTYRADFDTRQEPNASVCYFHSIVSHTVCSDLILDLIRRYCLTFENHVLFIFKQHFTWYIL